MTGARSRAMSLATFAPHVGSEFSVRLGDHKLPPLRLDEAAALPAHPRAPRQDPFSLLFSGLGPAMEQQTYRLDHPVLGSLDVFLVPVARGADGRVSYEAVFN